MVVRARIITNHDSPRWLKSANQPVPFLTIIIFIFALIMMDLKSLWIGDLVKIIGTEIIGSFEGMESDKIALIKVNHHIKKFLADQLELINEDEEITPDISDITSPDIIKPKNTRLDNMIDLHIERLNPAMLQSTPDRILPYQLQKFEEFIQYHMTLTNAYVIIIHGKGEGVLRQQIHELLSLKYKARMFRLINNDGATEAWL